MCVCPCMCVCFGVLCLFACWCVGSFLDWCVYVCVCWSLLLLFVFVVVVLVVVVCCGCCAVVAFVFGVLWCSLFGFMVCGAWGR